MAGRVDSFDRGQAGNFQLFLPSHSRGWPTSQLATSESNGTNSSQYSNPHSDLPFENYKATSTSTSTSSFETGWPNFQTDSGFVPIEQYRSLQARYDEMHQEYINLMKERVRLEAKNSVLKEAYDHLIERVPVSIGERTVLKRDNYPKITYWFRHEYFSARADDKITSVDDAPVKAQGAEHNEADDDDDNGNGEDDIGVHEQPSGAPKGKRGKGRALQGENVKMHYLQLENGEVIDGWRASDIRRYARSIFVGFALQGKVFQSWVEGVDAASRTSYYRDMVARFPEVGLCELDWKSEQIASEIYSHWQSNWISKQGSEKNKGKSESKRLVEESLEDPSHKKMKISKSRVTLDSSPAPDSSDLLKVPQINIIANTPARSAHVMGQVMAGSQFPVADVAPPLLNARPQYEFAINKPFTVAPSSMPPPSFFLPAANPLPPAQGSSNLGQRSTQGGKDSPNEIAQKASKRPNKMRANKHSNTPRNLCAKEWVEQYHGTVEEFAPYFSALPAEELEHFKVLSKSLSSNKDA